MTTMMTAARSTDRSALAARVAGIYLLTPDVNRDRFDAVAGKLQLALAAGISVAQYRNKLASAGERRTQAEALQRMARDRGALFIINDDIDLAVELGADGVHLGRDDGDIAAARMRLPQGLLGVSCYNDLERAARAVTAGADVLAFGSIFASSTKPHAVAASLDILRQARARFGPQRIVAIGGITRNNIGAVAAAGAHAAALISAVFDAADPGQAVRELQNQFSQGTGSA